MSKIRIPSAIALALLLPVAPAMADCEDGVAQLTSVMASVTDAYQRGILIRDLKQAQLDLWEFDEVECATALQHAARFLRRQAETATAAAAQNSGNK